MASSADDCPFCGPAPAEPFRPPQACATGPARPFFRCGACGTVFPRPRLSPDLSAVVLDALDKRERPLDPAVSPSDPLCRLIARHVDRRGPALDVGSSTGGFCAALDALGFEAHGVEPQATARAQAVRRGTRTYPGLFPELPAELAGRRFALISILEAIYYFPDMRGALKTVHDRLEPGGWLLIKGHHAESPVYADPARTLFKRFGDHAQGIPTPASLRFCLAAAGFEVVHLAGLTPADGLLGRLRAKLFPWTEPSRADRIVALARRLE
ncbi:MAG: class I SAM-dependent methyltransferase [Elusimicrobia bacterium]|nr:class I SAM-dependent methyltransferase [Elusimicrobiota bacterium]